MVIYQLIGSCSLENAVNYESEDIRIRVRHQKDTRRTIIHPFGDKHGKTSGVYLEAKKGKDVGVIERSP